MTKGSKKKVAPRKKREPKTSEKPLVVLRGVVIPVDWDQNGNVIATAISTHHEDEYLIAEDENSQGMNILINEAVEITGWCKKKGGKKIVTIKTCTRLSTEPNIANKPSEDGL